MKDKVILKLATMSLETAIGIVLIAVTIYLAFIEKVNVMPEGITFADTSYVLYQFLSVGVYAVILVVFCIGLGLTVNGIEKMHDAVEHGIRD